MLQLQVWGGALCPGGGRGGIQFLFAGLAGAHDDVHQNRDDHDDADDDVADGDLCARKLQAVLQYLPDGSADDGAEQNALTAEGGNAADNRGRDRVHLVGVACVHGAGAGGGAGDKADHAGAEGADNVSLGGGGDDIDA